MSDEKEKPERHPFAADRPIQSKKEDVLGRAKFASRVGEVLSHWREKDSLVLAVYAKWGHGKSSVKNMILEHIRDLKSEAPYHFVDFNPWEWADTHQLGTAFFREIQTVLGKVDKSN